MSFSRRQISILCAFVCFTLRSFVDAAESDQRPFYSPSEAAAFEHVCICVQWTCISKNPKGKCQLSCRPGGDLSSAPSCGEKQYSSDFIDIPLIEAAADPASERNPSVPRGGKEENTV